MEIFVDFGLFELLGLAAVAFMGKDERVRRRLRRAASHAAGKLGRCVRCMAFAATGLIISWIAVVALGAQSNRVVRFTMYAVWLAFATLSGLHLLAILYRSLTRLEGRLTRSVGGCNCGARRETRIERREET
jgi:hypothetical protein